MTGKKWFIGFISTFVLLLVLGGSVIAAVDPYLHYHKALSGLAYPLTDERYHNDGIMKHMDYDALITGSSMVQGFRNSDFEKLFDVSSIQVPFPGASYKEIHDNLGTAIRSQKKLKIVLQGLDYNRLLDDVDNMRYDEEIYPAYLYNENPFDDVNYVFNKSVFLNSTGNVIMHTLRGNTSMDFDSIADLTAEWTCGKNAVLGGHVRPEVNPVAEQLFEEDKDRIAKNITENLIDTVINNPQIEFYYFYSPYSIVFWDDLNRKNEIEKQLEADRYVASLLMPYENVHLYSFQTEFDIICNLDNYRDSGHYSTQISEQLLKWMKEGHGLLTEDNYEQYYQTVHDFYTNYDYDGIYE